MEATCKTSKTVFFAKNNKIVTDVSTSSALINFLWMKVPGVFHCSNVESKSLVDACYGDYDEDSHSMKVMCYVSRPTVSLNVFSISSMNFFKSYTRVGTKKLSDKSTTLLITCCKRA